MKKRMLIRLLSLSMILSLTACGLNGSRYAVDTGGVTEGDCVKKGNKEDTKETMKVWLPKKVYYDPNKDIENVNEFFLAPICQVFLRGDNHSTYSLDFDYDKNGMLTDYTFYKWDANDREKNQAAFAYNEDGQMTAVEHRSYSIDDLDDIQEADYNEEYFDERFVLDSKANLEFNYNQGFLANSYTEITSYKNDEYDGRVIDECTSEKKKYNLDTGMLKSSQYKSEDDDKNSNYTWDYDEAGRLTGFVEEMEGEILDNVAFEYYNDKLTRIEDFESDYHDAEILYDKDGRLTKCDDISITYNDMGDLQTVDGEGVNAEFIIDKDRVSVLMENYAINWMKPEMEFCRSSYFKYDAHNNLTGFDIEVVAKDLETLQEKKSGRFDSGLMIEYEQVAINKEIYDFYLNHYYYMIYLQLLEGLEASSDLSFVMFTNLGILQDLMIRFTAYEELPFNIFDYMALDSPDVLKAKIQNSTNDG